MYTMYRVCYVMSILVCMSESLMMIIILYPKSGFNIMTMGKGKHVIAVPFLCKYSSSCGCGIALVSCFAVLFVFFLSCRTVL